MTTNAHATLPPGVKPPLDSKAHWHPTRRVVHLLPDPMSPFETRRQGVEILDVDTVDDLIELLLPLRGRKLRVDSGSRPTVEIIGDLEYEGDDMVILDVVASADEWGE